jgi:superfamily II DNA or RNA helicase
MACFPDSFRFRHAWRPYQQRVLDAFDHHVGDRHFHVAAAPGAGKTILGLEAIRRLQRPALVLAPTTAIRDQWLQRLRESFLQQTGNPDWVSTDLARPSLFTVATYQGLHAAQRKLGLPALLDALQAVGLGTLVLDEAHHLRHQWWQCLVALKSTLGAPWLVALTATPPFDVPQAEWNRYIELCGPLDEEVSVPELVKAGNLCPHQDYLYFSRPTADEGAALAQFDRAVRALLNELLLQPELIDLLAGHPLVVSPELHFDALAQRSDFALALALFLNESAPERCRALLQSLGLDQVKLPDFHRDWAELLFNGLLFGRETLLPPDHEVLNRLTRRLRDIGAIEQRQVFLRAPPHLQRLLEGSRNKTHSVAAIIELEARSNPHTLRALVLCDHIREADFPQPGEAEPAFPHIGVVPVFEHLRKLRLPDVRLGVLTGSVLIVPATALAELRVLALESGLDADSIRSAPLWHAAEFHRLDVSHTDAGALLATMTRLFERGDVNVLIGTAALLGEGWDAPALNTLVLATAIRASMRSNQMRGRAIRVQPAQPDKTANIWHLACLLPRQPTEDPHAPPAGVDLDRLTQRFRTFAGIDIGATVIETGIDRLALDTAQLQAADVDALNAGMCRLALDRHAMRISWATALQDRSGSPQRMLLETRLPLRRLAVAVHFAHGLRWERNWLLRWLRAPLLRRRLRRIADALLLALQSAGLIRTGPAAVEVAVGEQRLRCRLVGASTQEEALFAESLRELFELPQAPRYLLRQKQSSFAVPASLGTNRKQADMLLEGFTQRVGRSELIYTRTDAGQRALLQARERWMAGRFDEGCDTRLRWR